MTIRCGVRSGDGVSPYYKAFLSQEIKNVGHTMVVGYVSEETTIQITQLWNSPFEGDTAGNASGVEKISSIGQTQTEITSTTLMNSRLVWEGAEALEFSLPLHFVAYADAKQEVDDPIKYLMMMLSPELKEHAPFGQRPQIITLDLGRKIKAPIYIKDVQYNANAPRTKDGYFTHNDVTLLCSLNGALNASQITQVFK